MLIGAGEDQILIDGLHQPHRPAYRAKTPALKAAMLAGEAPVSSIDAVLVSDIHRDHFDARDIADLLRARPGLLLLSSDQVVDSVMAVTPGFSD